MPIAGKLSFALAALAAAMTGLAQTESAFHDDFESQAASKAKWRASAGCSLEFVKGSSKQAMAFDCKDEVKDCLASAEIPIEQLRGKRALVTAMVKAEGVSGRKAPWNGVKLKASYKTKGGANGGEQATFEEGSFDWRKAELLVNIPDDVSSLSLVIGVEGAKGRALFDDVDVAAEKAAKAAAPEAKGIMMPGLKLTGVKGVQEGAINIDASEIRGDVNPRVFGVQIEAASGDGIFNCLGNKGVPCGRNGNGMWDPSANAPVPAIMQFAKDMGLRLMRYPGGCINHNYDWKKAIGPVEQRAEYAFGLDEFLRYCRELNAEPLILMADYRGTAQDACDLVEYLNSPADAAHPWAQKRAQNGHPEPYGVKLFELGNETDHGNHDLKPFKRFSAREYGEWASSYAKAMRKVDASIKLGAHVGTGTPPSDPWNSTVLSIVKDDIDFVAVHTYPQTMDYWLSAVDEMSERLSQYRAVIKESAGREIPLAITEYNLGSPRVINSAYAPAFFCADYVRYMLEPENNVMMAAYHDFLQQPFGLIRPQGRQSTWSIVKAPWVSGQSPAGDNFVFIQPAPGPNVWVKLPAYYFLRLWSQHFGSKLVKVSVDSPKNAASADAIPVPAFKYTSSAAGEGYAMRSSSSGGMSMEFSNFKQAGCYPVAAKAKVVPEARYMWSFKARVKGEPGPYVMGMQLADENAWSAQRDFAVLLEGAELSKEWRTFAHEATIPAGYGGVSIQWRVWSKEGAKAGSFPLNATIEVEDCKLMPITARAYDLLTSSASLSSDRRTLYLVVFNKSPENDIKAPIGVRGAHVESARAWMVDGAKAALGEIDSPEHPNYPQRELVGESVSGAPVAGAGEKGFSYVFPAHSMTAFEIKLK